ncbi:hypothetical protein PMEGAPR236_09850 [Priestia megaterium]|jgi:hypothetical protein
MVKLYEEIDAFFIVWRLYRADFFIYSVTILHFKYFYFFTYTSNSINIKLDVYRIRERSE